jgi:hypothetical protein
VVQQHGGGRQQRSPAAKPRQQQLGVHIHRDGDALLVAIACADQDAPPSCRQQDALLAAGHLGTPAHAGPAA